MSTAQVVNDGLWLCLCPNSVFPRFQRPVLATPGLRTLQRTTRTHHRRSAQTRSTPTYQAPWPLQSIRPCKNHRLLHDGFFQSRPNVEYEAGGVGLHETYETLRYSSRRLLYMKVHALVEYLVKKCGERPNLRMYEALILANAQAEYGSASEVSKLLQEMADAGIKPDSATYHAALRVMKSSHKTRGFSSSLSRLSLSTLTTSFAPTSYLLFANAGFPSRGKVTMTSLLV